MTAISPPFTEVLEFRRPTKLRAPKPNTQFVRHRDHLALFHLENQHSEYWREYWSESKRESLVQQGLSGSLGEFGSLVKEYVPKDLPVLEAGCGPAHLVAALGKHGYSAIGVDYEEHVVEFAKDALPDADIRQGNILNLDFETASLGCYLSVGVVEHFQDGPQEALAEARRVLHPDGVALISVPYLNPYRSSLLSGRQLAEQPMKDLSFHQYYYSPEEFCSHLTGAGFGVIHMLPYATEAFLVREHPVTSRLWASQINRNRIRTRLRGWFHNAPKWQRWRCGHMIMAVCRPRPAFSR